jgi:trigger factor
VPRRILEQRFKEQVEDDVIQRVVTKAYTDALKEKSVDAVSNPQVTNKGLQLDAPFAFEARVEVKPRLEPKDYVGVPMQRVPVKIEDAKVMEQIELIRQRLGRLEPVVDRDAVQRGDFAQIDFDATIGGKPFPGNSGENTLVEVAEGDISQGKLPGLEGMKVGEQRELDVKFPDSHPAPEVKGKTAHFKVSLKGFKRQIIPELNDELAKELQAGETLDQLKDKIRGDLERGAQAKANQEEREQLIRVLAERNPFDVPRAMVERAVSMMIQGAARAMADKGIDVNRLGIDVQRWQDEMRPKAMLEVRGSLLFEAIAQKESIQVTDEDLDKRIEKAATEEKVGLSQLRRRFRQPEERAQLQSRVREEKTVEFLKAKASYS